MNFRRKGLSVDQFEIVSTMTPLQRFGAACAYAGLMAAYGAMFSKPSEPQFLADDLANARIISDGYQRCPFFNTYMRECARYERDFVLWRQNVIADVMGSPMWRHLERQRMATTALLAVQYE